MTAHNVVNLYHCPKEGCHGTVAFPPQRDVRASCDVCGLIVQNATTLPDGGCEAVVLRAVGS